MLSWQSVIPFLQAVSFLIAIVGFVQVLHHHPLGMITLMLGVILFFIFFTMWVWTLLVMVMDTHSADTAAHKRSAKLQWAIRLVIFWMLAFSSSFALIPLYYWLNGTTMHVHGGAMSTNVIEDMTQVAADTKVSVYLRSQVSTDATPLSFVVEPEVMRLYPGEQASVKMKIHNNSDIAQTYRLVAKTAPDTAKQYLHFDYIDNAKEVVIKPKQSLVITPSLTVHKSIPKVLGDMSITMFLFSDKIDNAWKKMQNNWNY